MSDIDIDAQIACVKREINMRKNVYPRWIGQERMTQETADRELNTMRAVLATLERAAKAERPGLFDKGGAHG